MAKMELEKKASRVGLGRQVPSLHNFQQVNTCKYLKLESMQHQTSINATHPKLSNLNCLYFSYVPCPHLMNLGRQCLMMSSIAMSEPCKDGDCDWLWWNTVILSISCLASNAGLNGMNGLSSPSIGCTVHFEAWEQLTIADMTDGYWLPRWKPLGRTQWSWNTWRLHCENFIVRRAMASGICNDVLGITWDSMSHSNLSRALARQ